jgi:antitoxin CcdA
VNLSQTLETQLEGIVRDAARQRCREENREALESFNRYIEKYGSVADKFRTF